MVIDLSSSIDFSQRGESGTGDFQQKPNGQRPETKEGLTIGNKRA